MSFPPNPGGDFTGQDHDKDLGKITVQWKDIGGNAAAKVYAAFNYVWNGSTWIPSTGGGSGGTSSAFGAAFPGTGTAAGFKDNSGNMGWGTLDASGNLKVVTPPGGASAHVIVDSDAGQAIDYDANKNPLYFGTATPGTATSAAAWLIKKYLYDANFNPTRTLYANGSSSENQVWDNRAALAYS